jgi:hypothetical protein
MSTDLPDDDRPPQPFPEFFGDQTISSERWARWLRIERLRLISEGKIDPYEIPEWKGEPFVWKD